MDYDFLTLILVVIAFYAGWYARGATLLARFANDPEHFINILKQIKNINDQEDLEAHETANGTELRIERHGEVLYAFTKSTNEFIAQGPTLPDLLDEAQKRFPGKKFFGYISKEDSAKELV